MIIEQIPGEVEINDVTKQLKNKYYWPSYNVPYSKKLFEKCGYKNLVEKNAHYIANIDYKNCSRAKIFERDQKNIKTIEDFKHLLRYNDYKNDELSYNDPSLTIACRDDLDKDSVRCDGATDVKLVSVKELLEGKIKAHIISGPTNEQQPTFSWSTTTCNKKNPDIWQHDGIIDTWEFDWVDYKAQFYEFNKQADNSDDNSDYNRDDNIDDNNDDNDDKKKVWIICLSVACGIVIIIISAVFIFFFKSKLTYDKLNEKIKEISFSEKDRNNEKTEDLLLNK